jgi:hypothetical protein
LSEERKRRKKKDDASAKPRTIENTVWQLDVIEKVTAVVMAMRIVQGSYGQVTRGERYKWNS